MSTGLAMSAGLPAWPDVLVAALVGTQRRALPVPASRVDDPAAALLDAAGALGSYRRAAAMPVRGAPVPDPAPIAGTPLVPPPAALRGGELLAFDGPRAYGPLREVDSRVELLVEWLGAVAATGRRVPPELVPSLLDAGRRHRALRPVIGPAAGPLAGWLAAQRSDWRYALAVPAQAPAPGRAPEPDGIAASTVPGTDAEDSGGTEAWELGDIGRRYRYLAGLRATQPAGARALLEATWEQETPEDRATLLGALAGNLSLADEQLLERALDDRRREVRAVAAELLARLAGSGYARRMVERATACVDVAGTGRITLTPPVACDRAMRRDGIAPKPPGGVGERSWWLEEVLARTPLEVWPGPPAVFLGRPTTEGWHLVLHRGLARAAVAQRDPAWATALVGVLAGEVSRSRRPDDRLLLEAVYDVLPAEELADRAAGALRRGLVQAATLGVERILELCPRPWPEPVAEAFLYALERAAAAGGPRDVGWRLTGLCGLAALRLPVTRDQAGAIGGAGAAPAPGDTIAGRVAALAERLCANRPTGSITAVVDNLAATIRYRRRMLEELA